MSLLDNAVRQRRGVYRAARSVVKAVAGVLLRSLSLKPWSIGLARHRSSLAEGFKRQSSLGKAIEVLTLMLLAVTPFLLGTVHPWHILLTSLLAVTVLALELWRKIMHRGRVPAVSVIGLGLAVGLAWTLLQAVPLPLGLVGVLSPRAAEIREFVFEGIEHSGFAPLSLDPAGTLIDGLRFAGLLSLFLVAANRLAARGARTRRIATGIVLTAAAVSAVGLIQKLFGVGAILGLYETPAIDRNYFTATFVNPNHLAGYLGLIAPIGVGLAIESRDRAIRLLYVVASVLIAVGAILSLSRGGIIAFIAGQLFLVLLLLRRRFEGGGRGLALAPIAAGVVVAVAAFLAYDEISAELETLEDPAEISADSKIQSWKPLAPMTADFWATGIGRGAFATVYPLYKELRNTGTFTHPENEVLQVLVESGLPVGLVVLGALLAGLAGLALRRRTSPSSCGMLAGLFACSLHNLVDFNLETGAVGLAYFVMLGLLVGRWIRRRESGAAWPGGPRIAPGKLLVGVGAVLLIGISAGSWAAEHGLDSDTARVRAADLGDDPGGVLQAALDALTRRPADHYPAYVAARALAGSGRLQEALHWVNRAQYLNPSAVEPHELAAWVLRRLKKHRQAQHELRLAAEKAGGSGGAVLDRAFKIYRRPSAWLRMTPETREPRLYLARQFLRAGKPLDAQAVLEPLLEADRGDYDALMTAANASRALKLLADARRHAELAIAARPDEYRPYMLLYQFAEGGESRLAALERGLAALPDNGTLLSSKAVLQIREGAYDEAIETIGRLRRAAGPDPRRLAHAAALLGRVESARGNRFQAIQRYRRAVELDARNANHRLALIRLYERTDQADKAIAEWAALVKLFPEQSRYRESLEALKAKQTQLRDRQRIEALESGALVP